MVTVKLSDKECFVCGKTEKTVDVRFSDGTLKGTMCIWHLWTQMVKKSNGYQYPQREQSDAASVSEAGS